MKKQCAPNSTMAQCVNGEIALSSCAELRQVEINGLPNTSKSEVASTA